jgi:hypothetical protein
MVSAVLALIGCFLPLVSSPFGGGGFESSIIAGVKEVKFLLIFPLSLIGATVVGLLLGTGAVRSKAGWFSLAGLLAGITGSMSIFMIYGSASSGVMNALGVGFWFTVMGSLTAMVLSVVGAFQESS